MTRHPHLSQLIASCARIDQRRLKEILHYDQSTGLFTWKVAKARKIKIGGRAGGDRGDGYISIKIDDRSYLSHRLAWLYMTGEWPKTILDHKDRNRSNNVWTNLREADRFQNMANRPLHKNNKVGLKGVHWKLRVNKWCAQIYFGKKCCHLGYYNTPEEAHAAYCGAARVWHGEFRSFK